MLRTLALTIAIVASGAAGAMACSGMTTAEVPAAVSTQTVQAPTDTVKIDVAEAPKPDAPKTN